MKSENSEVTKKMIKKERVALIEKLEVAENSSKKGLDMSWEKFDKELENL